MRALVLSGGAAAGAYEAGVAYALTARESFDIFCGTSIGAINAAALAQGRRDSMRTVWASIAALNITRLRPELDVFRRIVDHVTRLRRSPALKKPGAAVRMLSELRHLREAHDLIHVMSLFPWDPILRAVEPVLDLPTMQGSLVLGVTNLTEGSATAFYSFPQGDDAREASFRQSEPSAVRLTDANYLGAVCASAALPPAFEPVWLEDASGKRCAFADGGIANNTPIRQAIDAGAAHITVIFMGHAALNVGSNPITNMAEIVFCSSRVTIERILDLDLKLLRSVNERVRLGMAPGKRFVDVRVIGPSVPLQLEGMHFDDQSTIDRVFDLGVRDGEAASASRPQSYA